MVLVFVHSVPTAPTVAREKVSESVGGGQDMCGGVCLHTRISAPMFVCAVCMQIS